MKNRTFPKTHLCPKNHLTDKRVKEPEFSRIMNNVSGLRAAQKALSKSTGKHQMNKNLSIDEYTLPDDKKSLVARAERACSTAQKEDSRKGHFSLDTVKLNPSMHQTMPFR